MNDDEQWDNDLLIAVVIMIAITLLLGLSSCGNDRTQACVSPCGIRLRAPSPEQWTCAALAEVEARTVYGLAPLGGRYSRACVGLGGWALTIVPDRVWASPRHATAENPQGLVTGLTYCDSWTMFVGDSTPAESSLPHEMVHAVERCTPSGHSHWFDAGIYDAIGETP